MTQHSPSQQASFLHNRLVEFVHLLPVNRAALLFIHNSTRIGDVCILRIVPMCGHGCHQNKNSYGNACGFSVLESWNKKNKVSESHRKQGPAGLSKQDVQQQQQTGDVILLKPAKRLS